MIRSFCIFLLAVYATAFTYMGCSQRVENREIDFSGTIITGTVKFIDIEGGFYGIISDDGTKLDPLNLSVDYQEDGLRIKAGISIKKNVVTIRMWGTPVQINQIQKIDYSR